MAQFSIKVIFGPVAAGECSLSERGGLTNKKLSLGVDKKGRENIGPYSYIRPPKSQNPMSIPQKPQKQGNIYRSPHLVFSE